MEPGAPRSAGVRSVDVGSCWVLGSARLRRSAPRMTIVWGDRGRTPPALAFFMLRCDIAPVASRDLGRSSCVRAGFHRTAVEPDNLLEIASRGLARRPPPHPPFRRSPRAEPAARKKKKPNPPPPR